MEADKAKREGAGRPKSERRAEAERVAEESGKSVRQVNRDDCGSFATIDPYTDETA